MPKRAYPFSEPKAIEWSKEWTILIILMGCSSILMYLFYFIHTVLRFSCLLYFLRNKQVELAVQTFG